MKKGDYVVYCYDRNISNWKHSLVKKRIWQVTEIVGDKVRLQSILDNTDKFKTSMANVFSISEVEYHDCIHLINHKYYDLWLELTESASYFDDAYDKEPKNIWDGWEEIEVNTHKEPKSYFDGWEIEVNKHKVNQKTGAVNKMMKTNVVDNNVRSAKIGARIVAGKTLNNVIKEKITPHMPLMVRGYKDTIFADVIIANIAKVAVDNFASDNRKAVYAANAMMEAAMVDLLASFNFEALISDALSNVNLEELEA